MIVDAAVDAAVGHINDGVPLVSDKSGEPKVVGVVLTSSEEDRIDAFSMADRDHHLKRSRSRKSVDFVRLSVYPMKVGRVTILARWLFLMKCDLILFPPDCQNITMLV